MDTMNVPTPELEPRNFNELVCTDVWVPFKGGGGGGAPGGKATSISDRSIAGIANSEFDSPVRKQVVVCLL